MSNEIHWDKSFEIGITEMDEQHRMLVSIANEILSAKQQHIEDATIAKILDALIEYTQQHFQHEEKLMEDMGYPNLPEHRRQHKMLMNDVLLFKSKFLTNDLSIPELANFLKNWILDHIKEHDREYGTYLRSHGIV